MIKNIIKTNWIKEQDRLEILQKIDNLLKSKWDGKKLNKRLETQLKEILGDKVMVSFNQEYGTYTLSIWNIKSAETFDKRLSLYFGGNVDNYDASTFAKEHYLDAMRARQNARTTLLADETALQEIKDNLISILHAKETIQNNSKKIKSIDDNDYYSIMALAELKELGKEIINL